MEGSFGSEPSAAAVTRRRLLTLAGWAAGGAALGACTTEDRAAHREAATHFEADVREVRPGNGAAIGRPGTPVATATAGPELVADPVLRSFLALSATITGVEQLDPTAGKAYMAALRTPPAGGMTLAQLEDALGSGGGSGGLAALPPAGTTTAKAMAQYWYSGQTPGAGSAPAVVTYLDALGWRALGFAGAPSSCGGPFDFCGERPA